LGQAAASFYFTILSYLVQFFVSYYYTSMILLAESINLVPNHELLKGKSDFCHFAESINLVPNHELLHDFIGSVVSAL